MAVVMESTMRCVAPPAGLPAGVSWFAAAPRAAGASFFGATITDAQIKQLREHLQLERAAVNNAEVPGRTRLLGDFHLVLAQMLGNQVLVQMLSELLTRSSLIALMRQSSQSAEESLDEHVAIVDAFEKRDVKAAVRLVSKHLANVQHNLHLDPQRVDLADILHP
jgi:DNA-binding GntR family transcriptional regulator